MLSSPGPVKLLRTAATTWARVYLRSMNTVCSMAFNESTTSAKPMWVAPEELYTEPPRTRSRPLSRGPSNRAESSGEGIISWCTAPMCSLSSMA